MDERKKTAVILTGGRLDLAFAGAFLETHRADCLVAVDAGLEKADAMGLTPDAVVGDFDTARPEVVEAYRKRPHILWEIHRPEKDETDTMLAVETAVRLGCTRLWLLGATGGRLDHELSNLHLLKYCLDRGVEAYLCDSQNQVCLISGEKTFERGALYGTYISFLPMTEQVKGITLRGFRYPLKNKNIAIGADVGLCVSNEMAADTAVVSLESGILIAIESRDDNWTG